MARRRKRRRKWKVGQTRIKRRKGVGLVRVTKLSRKKYRVRKIHKKRRRRRRRRRR